MARTSGEGAFITAEAGGVFYKEEIVKYGTEGNDGGPVWEAAEAGSAEKNVNGGKGYGWQVIEIGGIIVSDNTLTIGFTNDKYLTGKAWTGTWFSADDFQLFYNSDKMTCVRMMNEDNDLQVIAGHGTIEVITDEPYWIFNISGVQVTGTKGLAAGMYIVRCGDRTRKVLVK